jgi:hypothetical protein
LVDVRHGGQIHGPEDSPRARAQVISAGRDVVLFLRQTVDQQRFGIIERRDDLRRVGEKRTASRLLTGMTKAGIAKTESAARECPKPRPGLSKPAYSSRWWVARRHVTMHRRPGTLTQYGTTAKTLTMPLFSLAEYT